MNDCTYVMDIDVKRYMEDHGVIYDQALEQVKHQAGFIGDTLVYAPEVDRFLSFNPMNYLRKINVTAPKEIFSKHKIPFQFL